MREPPKYVSIHLDELDRPPCGELSLEDLDFVDELLLLPPELAVHHLVEGGGLLREVLVGTPLACPSSLRFRLVDAVRMRELLQLVDRRSQLIQFALPPLELVLKAQRLGLKPHNSLILTLNLDFEPCACER
jgi:hypothetical protein